MLRPILLAVFCVVSTQTYATDKAVDLEVQGTITAAPYYSDASNVVITSITMSFDSQQAAAATRMVESDQQPFILHDPANPGTVRILILQNPTGCSIGTNLVSDDDISLVAGGVEAPSGAVGIQEGQVMYVSLRFAAAGDYGDKSGSVSCTTPGSLTYSY